MQESPAKQFYPGQKVQAQTERAQWATAKIGSKLPVVGVNGLHWYPVVFPNRKRGVFDTNNIREIASAEPPAQQFYEGQDVWATDPADVFDPVKEMLRWRKAKIINILHGPLYVLQFLDGALDIVMLDREYVRPFQAKQATEGFPVKMEVIKRTRKYGKQEAAIQELVDEGKVSRATVFRKLARKKSLTKNRNR